MKKNIHGNRYHAVAPDGAVDWDHPLNRNNRGQRVGWYIPGLPGTPAAGGRLLNLCDPKNQSHGTLNGQTSATPMWGGQAAPNGLGSISLGSSAQFVGCGNPSALSFERTQAFSVAYWLKTSSTSVGDIVNKGQASGSFTGWAIVGNQDNLGANVSGTQRMYLIGSGTATAQCSFPNDGKWHFMVMTYDGSSAGTGITGYQDGNALSMTATGSATTSILITNQFAWGAYDAGNTGLVFNLGLGTVFNWCLTAKEQRLEYFLSLQGYRTPDSPLRWISTRAWFVPSVAPASITMLPELFVSA